MGNKKLWFCLLYLKLYPFVDRQFNSVQKISFGIRTVTCRMPPVSLLFVGKWYPVLMRQLVRQDRKAGSIAHSTRRTVSLLRENKFVQAVQSCVHMLLQCEWSLYRGGTGFDSCLAYRLPRLKFLCAFQHWPYPNYAISNVLIFKRKIKVEF